MDSLLKQTLLDLHQLDGRLQQLKAGAAPEDETEYEYLRHQLRSLRSLRSAAETRYAELDPTLLNNLAHGLIWSPTDTIFTPYWAE